MHISNFFPLTKMICKSFNINIYKSLSLLDAEYFKDLKS